MAEHLREALNGATVETLTIYEAATTSDDEESETRNLISKERRPVEYQLNTRVTRVVTKGKRAVILLDDQQGILIAFALTGKLEYQAGKPVVTSATVAILSFSVRSKKSFITLTDPQHLAFVTLDKSRTIIDTMLATGFDPLHTIAGMREWLAVCKLHPGQLVANFITNQNIVAGVGNRYRSEVIYVAKIPPDSRVRDLSSEQLQMLLIAIYRVLKLASRGEYVFAVYGRKESFPKGEPVIRAEVAKGILIYTTAKNVLSARKVLRRGEAQLTESELEV